MIIKITFSLHAIILKKDCLGYLKFDPMNTFMTREFFGYELAGSTVAGFHQ